MVKAKKRRSGCAASIIIAVIVVAAAYFIAFRRNEAAKDKTAGSSAEQSAALPDAGSKIPDETADGAIAAPSSGWYGFLTDSERETYAKVYGAVAAGKESFTVDFNYYNDDRDEIQKCAKLCMYDHPEFIKYNGSFEFEYTYDGDTGDGELEFRLGTNSHGAEAQKRFDEVLSSLVAGAQKLPTDFERALFVHDELVKNTVYDGSSADAHSPYGCLVNGSAVCEGYAKAYLAAMNRLGIDCLYVAGRGRNESHAWNCVKLGGEWYFVDVTWDDPERDEKFRDVIRHDYFGLTTEEAQRDHTPDGEFPSVPLCTATKYNYHTYYGLVLDPYTREGAAALFDSGATSIKFLSGEQLDKAAQDLFKDGGCFTIEAFAGRRFAYSDDHMIINVYFED